MSDAKPSLTATRIRESRAQWAREEAERRLSEIMQGIPRGEEFVSFHQIVERVVGIKNVVTVHALHLLTSEPYHQTFEFETREADGAIMVRRRSLPPSSNA